MMRTVVCIVEGDGEVLALPVLLRRMALWRAPHLEVSVPQPIRVRRDRFIRRDEDFGKHLALAAAKARSTALGAVLVLLDADDDCPATLGPELAMKLRLAMPHVRNQLVLANREYEAWFIAAAQSLHGRRGLKVEPHVVIDPDQPRDAKGWMRERMAAGTYSPVADQPAFSAHMDLELAYARSRSFRKLTHAWDILVS